MDFSNQAVSPKDLPTVESVSFHPLEDKYLVVERLSFAITLVIVLGIALPLFYFTKLPSFLMAGAIVAIGIFAFLAWVSTTFDFNYAGYALREKDLLYRSGWFIRKTRVVLLSRIQHISVQSGPIERKFGLASISIFTAGASQADFTIKGISEETARNIKEWANNQVNGAIGQ